MAQGPSGRIVIEIEPSLKRELHGALAAAGISLKDWFLEQAGQFLAERNQLRLPGLSEFSQQTNSMMLAAEDPVPYKTTNQENK